MMTGASDGEAASTLCRNDALGTSGNWGAAYNDAREVLCAKLIHNATAA